MFTAAFWRDAVERSLSTVAEAGVGAIVVSGATGAAGVSWGSVASVAGLAGIIALLKSVAAAHIGDTGSASLVAAPGRHAKPEA